MSKKEKTFGHWPFGHWTFILMNRSLLTRFLIAKKKAWLKPQKGPSILKKIISGIVILVAVGVLGLTILTISVLSDIPELPTRFEKPESTLIFDREGNLLYAVHGEENRVEIPLNEIPKHLIDASIAIEDDRFFEHSGFDVGGMVKGFFAEYLRIGKRRGGSTITQQLVKNTLLTPERTLTRKIKELIIAVQLERTFSKNEILSMYLNTIPYGNNAYGIEMASRIYFDKHAKDLNLAETAILASLPQAPSRHNPYGNGREELMGYFDQEGNYISGRKDVVLKRMEDLGYITAEERRDAFADASKITFKKAREKILHPHFVLYIKELLETKYGKELVETGGLQVFTTLDPTLQKKAEETITERIKDYPQKYEATNAGLLTVDLKKGQILAMVGSADYFNEEIDGNVNMVFRKRQPGSSFKPMVYAAGFMKGYSPATVLFDVETDFGNKYVPQNYDGKFRGPVPARKALANSLNIPAVKMAFLAGVDNVINLAKKMGVSDLLDSEQYGTSIGIGTGEATLYQMVTAFSVFAKGGKKIEFSPFLRIETSDGKMLEDYTERVPEEEEVLDPQIAYSVNHVLSDRTARADFWNTWLLVPDQIAAAKTGTSNKRFKEGKTKDAIKPLDNWAIGYTTRFATGVWVGNNDASPLKVGSDGISTAAPIWNMVMREATKKEDLQEFPKPPGISWMQVSKWSGLLPSPNTPSIDLVPELFTTFNTPVNVDQTFQSVLIDRVSKKLPTTLTPKEAITEAWVLNFHSENRENPDWENPVLDWEKKYVTENVGDRVLLDALPTEYDDVHTAQTIAKLPTISLVAPHQGDQVSVGTVDVIPAIDATYGVEKVEFFLDNRLIKTTTIAPYIEKLRIQKKDLGKSVLITVKVTDRLFSRTEASVQVTIGEIKDTIPPEIRISAPEEGAIFTPDTLMTIQTMVKDNISVMEVAFYLDDRLLGKAGKSPYQWELLIPDEVAPHTIRAIVKDAAGNSAFDDVTIRIKDEPEGERLKTEFSFPMDGTTLKKGSASEIFFSLSAADQKVTTNVRVLAKNATTKLESVIFEKTFAEKAVENFSFLFSPDAAGNYELVIEVTPKEGEKRVSEVLKVKVE